ncbi:MAG TPA: hypothetical protein VMB48_10005 [Steroidobacteraceae bacterium]|nr:hypothetical protein [Steroidobacteraceae bacterium]
MYTPPSAPRSIGGVLDDTIQLYKTSFTACVIASTFLALLAFGLGLYTRPHSPATHNLQPLAQQLAALATAVPPHVMPVYLVYLVLAALGYLVMLVQVTRVAGGETALPLGAAIGRAAGRLPATIGAGILFLIFIIVGTVLLIIPGVYLWNRLQLFAVPLVAEGVGVEGSLSRSWHMVAGHWWRTATIIGVIFIILLVLDLLIAPVAAALFFILHADVAGTLLITQALEAVLRVFTTPLVIATLVAIYGDLRLRKEGADIEARMGGAQRS